MPVQCTADVRVVLGAGEPREVHEHGHLALRGVRGDEDIEAGVEPAQGLRLYMAAAARSGLRLRSAATRETRTARAAYLELVLGELALERLVGRQLLETHRAAVARWRWWWFAIEMCR